MACRPCPTRRYRDRLRLAPSRRVLSLRELVAIFLGSCPSLPPRRHFFERAQPELARCLPMLQVESLQAAARSLGQPLIVIPASTEALIEEAFATMVQRKVAGIIYGANVFFQLVQDKLITL